MADLDLRLDPLRCDFCSMRFTNNPRAEQGLAEHVREFHPERAEPPKPVYVAPHVPGKNQGAITSPPFPAAISALPDPLTCPHCSATVKNKAGLAAHIRIKHGSPKSNPPPAA